MDLMDLARAIAALAATLALIGLAALAARRLGLMRAALGAKTRRLSVAERLLIDARRQIIIIRCDDTKHMLLLSPFGDRRIAAFPAVKQPEPAEPKPEGAE